MRHSRKIAQRLFSEKWVKLFSENDSLPLLYKLVAIVFSIPVSNAFVEQVFSLVSSQWSKERNRLSEKTVKSLLQVRVNLDFSCSEMHEVISKDQKLLSKFLVVKNIYDLAFKSIKRFFLYKNTQFPLILVFKIFSIC